MYAFREWIRGAVASNMPLDEFARRIVTSRGGPHDDLWVGLRLVVDALSAKGVPALGLAPLGSFLWSSASTPAAS